MTEAVPREEPRLLILTPLGLIILAWDDATGFRPCVTGGARTRHEDREYPPLAPALAAHLKSEVHIGLYLLLNDGRFRQPRAINRRLGSNMRKVSYPSCSYLDLQTAISSLKNV